MDDKTAMYVCSILKSVKTGSPQKGHQVLRRCKSDKPSYTHYGKTESNIKKKKLQISRFGKENMEPAVLQKSAGTVLHSADNQLIHPLACSNMNISNIQSSHFNNQQSSNVENEDSLDSVHTDFLFDSNNNQASYSSGARQENGAHDSVTTPPPSPTWNLKILCNAVSPEIRRMQMQKETGCEEERASSNSLTSSSTTTNQIPSPSEENSHDYTEFASSQDSALSLELEIVTSRKDKSLGRLCDK